MSPPKCDAMCLNMLGFIFLEIEMDYPAVCDTDIEDLIFNLFWAERRLSVIVAAWSQR